MPTYLPLSSIRRFEAAKAFEAELPLLDELEQTRQRHLAWEAEQAAAGPPARDDYARAQAVHPAAGGPPVRDDYAREQAPEPPVGGPPVRDDYARPRSAAPPASGPPVRDDYARPRPEPPTRLPTWDELAA